MNQDLYNIIKTIGPVSPDMTPEQAHKSLGLSAPFVRASFWWALSRALRFAKSTERQARVAEWLYAWKARAEGSGQAWPPLKLEIRNKYGKSESTNI